MKKQILSSMILLLSLSAVPCSAVTMIESSRTQAAESYENDTNIQRAELIERTSDGTIKTSMGTFSIQAAEVIDNRPIDSWYVAPANAKVSLYYQNKRLVKVVIYQ